LAGTYIEPERPLYDAEKNRALKRHGERVALFADDRSHCVKLTLGDNKLTIEAGTADRGKATGSVATTWEQPEWVAGFNWNYILDFLRLAGSPAVDLLFGDNENKPVIFTSGDWKYCLMQMRI
jgi:DNA polymerase-3 subunit beta